MPDRTEIAAFRFGYGLPAAGAAEPQALVAGLAGPDEALARWPAHGTAEVLALLAAFKEARTEAKAAEGMEDGGKPAKKAQRRAVQEGRRLAVASMQAAMARAIGSATPFRERMVAFWADHFTVTPRNRTQMAWPGAFVDEAIRPHLAGRFADLLAAATLHPAMLIYLDQVASLGPNSKRGANRGKGLNENLARELLELHTLGVGAGYSQADVREMAELLTGLTFVPDRGFAFDKARVEPGADLVLGVEYGGEGTEPILRALDDLSVRPETARHIATKLAVHFTADTPDAGLVAALEAEWLRTGGDLAAVAGVLTGHPAAWAPGAGKARQPWDFVVAALRALGVAPEAITALDEDGFLALLHGPMKAMGQDVQNAPGPDGWPEAAEDWITPQAMAARIDWAVDAPGRLLAALPEPRAFALAALGSRADERLLWAVDASESRAEAVGLVLASPAFNRR